jgi:hypothetical protein
VKDGMRRRLHGPSTTVSEVFWPNRGWRRTPRNLWRRRSFPRSDTSPAPASGAEECGCSTAWPALSVRSKPPISLAKMAVAGRHREGGFLPSGVLTFVRLKAYILVIRHAAASVRRRVFEAPHRYSVTRLPIPIGGRGLRRLSGSPEGGAALVPGCLIGESEERETWTAESLRAVPSIGDLSSREVRPDETSAVDVSGQHPCRESGRRACDAQSRARLSARERVVGPRQTL